MTGKSIENILVLAEGISADFYPEQRFATTDENGDYTVKVAVGRWSVVASDFASSEYVSLDTVDVAVGEDETRLLNFQLQKFNSFVEGYTRFENGTPVPGIYLMAVNVDSYLPFLARSDESGYYRMGAEPGQVGIMASPIYNLFMPDSPWPEGYYADPESDTVTVISGQTARADFNFKPYSSFIEGDCTADDQGLAGVMITAVTFNMETFEFHTSVAVSDQGGHYRIGVKPGNVSLLNACLPDYQLVSPIGGYMDVNVSEGQTVTSKDFAFSKTTGEMSIAGQVAYDAGGPAVNVYVVAINDVLNGPAGYRIQYTGGGRHYLFDGLIGGSWKVGVYQTGYGSRPPMIHEFLLPGDEIADADFVLEAATAVSGDVAEYMPDCYLSAPELSQPV